MSSKIGNRRIMMALGRALGIEDVTQAPAHMKVDELIPVVSLDPGMAGYEPWQSVGAGINIAGLSGVTWVIVGNMSGSGFMDPYRQVDNGDKEYSVLGLRVQLTYSAAGGTTDESQTNFVSYWRQVIPGGAGVQAAESYVGLGQVENTGGTAYYLHTFPMYLKRQSYALGDPYPSTLPVLNIRPLWVPAGTAFGLTLAKDSGGAWPAGTTVDVNAWGIKTPKGMRPPGI